MVSRSPYQLSTIRWPNVVITFDFGLTSDSCPGVADLQSAGGPAPTRAPGRFWFSVVGEERPRAIGPRLDIFDAHEDGTWLRHPQPGRRIRGESPHRVAPRRAVRVALRTRGGRGRHAGHRVLQLRQAVAFVIIAMGVPERNRTAMEGTLERLESAVTS